MDRFANPALLIVDMQNDFVRQGAPLEVPQARQTIAVHRRLIAACRTSAVPVIYTKFLAGPKRTLIWERSPVLAPPVCCWRRSCRPCKGRLGLWLSLTPCREEWVHDVHVSFAGHW